MNFVLVDRWDRKLVSLLFFKSKIEAKRHARQLGLGAALLAQDVLVVGVFS